MALTRYVGVVAYHGARFHGWQTQPEGNTVQDHLEAALSVCLRQAIKITGASRTDSGVHAEAQVFVFDYPGQVDLERTQRSINALTPPEIALRRLAVAPSDQFNPIKAARAKLYRYSICTAAVASPFLHDYLWHLPSFEVANIRKITRAFIGTHNFKSFAAADGSAKTFERRIIDIEVLQDQDYLHLLFLGEGFLKQMVRNLVGTTCDVAQGRMALADLPEIIAAQDRRRAGRTAPAQGLSLLEIFYGDGTPSVGDRIQSYGCFPFNLSADRVVSSSEPI